ncbi:tetratricopeptide repeat protein [Cohnella suwonensis]|uniref:Tetratricopeptide repeat protein n=1 Tax=Cohnella suwonensis TaxID=696072 RepID=A0ABW0M650_9BACL
MKISLSFKVEKFLYEMFKQFKPDSFQYFNKIKETKDAQSQIKIITKYILFEPDDAQAYYFRGLAYYELSRYEEAINDFTKCLEIDDEMYHVINCRGMCYYFISDYEKALDDLLKTNKADICNIFLYRADIYRTLGDNEKAIENFKLAKDEEPNNENIIFELSALYFSTKQLNEAIEHLSYLIENTRKLDVAHDLRGCAYSASKRYELARNDFNWCIERESIDGRNYYNRGLTYFYTFQYESSLNDFKKALDLGYNDNPNVYIFLGRTEMANNNFSAAINWFNKAEILNDQNAKVYFFRCIANKALMNESNYYNDLVKAKSINPNIDNEAYE